MSFIDDYKSTYERSVEKETSKTKENRLMKLISWFYHRTSF